MNRHVILLLLVAFICSTAIAQKAKDRAPLILVSDSLTGKYGYKNEAGKIIVPMGRYSYSYTDTFRNYAIVIDSGNNLIAVDRQFRSLYKVFVFDNGPDYPAEGLFRIKVAGKIGYADSASGRIVVKPQYACAYPFENGKAMVALNCKTRAIGEHSTWDSDEWFYINKAGQRVNPSAK